MAVPFSNTKLRVPQGFQSLLEGVAREVLQMQPNDIFAFSAVYFENLLQLRESGVVDPVAQMSRTQDRMYNNKAFQKPDVDINNEEQQDAAVKIQTKYRQHQSKAVVDQMRQDKAATKIQAGIRGHLGRRRVTHLRKQVASSSHGSFNAAEDGNDLEELAQEDEFNINDYDEEDTARTQGSVEMTPRVESDDATVRKSPANEDAEDGFDLNDPGVQSAATKIQAGFRGMRTRQNLKPRQKVESTDDIEGDLTTRTEPEDVEPNEGETERQETPNSKRNMSGVQGEEDEEIELNEDDPETIKAIEEIQAGFRRLKAEAENEDEDDEVVEMSNEREKLENSEMEAAAATKIQAGFKGMKLRQELKGKKVEKKAINEDPKEIQPEEEETDAGNLSSEENSDTELRVAANKIQAGFRGYKTRKEVQRLRRKKGEELASRSQEEMNGEREAEEEIENGEDEAKRVMAAGKIQAGFKGYKTRREVEILRKEKAKVSEKNEEGSEDEEKRVVAASKIQAGFKGYKTRKEVEILRKEKAKVGEKNEEGSEDEEKRVVAASKIQAGFKGYKTRREVEILRKEKAKVGEKNEEGSEDEGKRVVAARKIQAGFRGYKTRKEVEILQKEKAKVGEKNEDEEEIQEDEDA